MSPDLKMLQQDLFFTETLTKKAAILQVKQYMTLKTDLSI